MLGLLSLLLVEVGVYSFHVLLGVVELGVWSILEEVNQLWSQGGCHIATLRRCLTLHVLYLNSTQNEYTVPWAMM